MPERNYAGHNIMKALILAPVVSLALLLCAGCQTTEESSQAENQSERLAIGQKCAHCNCQAYSPGRLIKGVCKECGHTAAEHSGHGQ
jgi:hypothetical protein